MNPTCPKCGQQMIGPQWVSEYGRESLRYVCACGYSVRRPTKDAEARAALRGKP